jgi:hypothetical protein
MRQASFATDKMHSDDEVVWDNDEEYNDAGSSAAAQGSSATYSDDGSEELEDPGEPLSHSSKSPGPSSLRDWSEDDDDEPEPTVRRPLPKLRLVRSWKCRILRSSPSLPRSR